MTGDEAAQSPGLGMMTLIETLTPILDAGRGLAARLRSEGWPEESAEAIALDVTKRAIGMVFSKAPGQP